MHTSIQHRLRKISEDQNKDDQHIIAELTSIVRDIEFREKSTLPSKKALDIFESHVNDIGMAGETIETGISDFDECIPLVRGEYVVIGGRPAMGKTHLLMNLALNMSTKVPVLYCSFDLSEGLLMKRMVAALSRYFVKSNDVGGFESPGIAVDLNLLKRSFKRVNYGSVINAPIHFRFYVSAVENM